MTTAHIGKMAEDRATNGTVKDFGRTLVQDHTSDYQQLCALAMKTGEAIPTGIDKQDDRGIATLERYKGKMFDHAFLTRETAAHEELLHAFKREAEHGSNPAIKDYASKALPTLERHLHQAEDLLKQRAWARLFVCLGGPHE